MIKNVILDMGNVVLKFDPEVSLNKYCKSNEEKDIIRQALFKGEEWIMGDKGEISDKDLYEKVKHKVPEKYHETLKNVADNWDICIVPLDGTKQFCDYLKEKKYGLYILSNASDRYHKYFPEIFPLDYFTGLVFSCDIHIIKPDEGIFKYILNKYNLKAEECLFIDDIESNIKGAEKVNMKGEVFKNNYDYIIKKYNL